MRILILLILLCSCGEDTHRSIGTSPSGPTQVDDEPEGLSGPDAGVR